MPTTDFSMSAKLSAGEVFLLIAVVGIVFAFLGRPVPFNNEYVYLLRLLDGFLPNDWTFSSSANEHAIFNYIFSLPAAVLPIELVGWLGRLFSWVFCGFGIILLARYWNLTLLSTGISFFFWILIGQSVVNGEWIFGGFEAKTIAYSFLLLALWMTAAGKLSIGGVFLGLTFAFHPAVGIWSTAAASVAVFAIRPGLTSLIRFYILILVGMLPGILPLLGNQLSADANNNENWKFLVTQAIAHHLDPYAYSRSEFGCLFIMFFFAVAYMLSQKRKELTFLTVFLSVLAIFYIAAFILRATDQFTLLRFMPMRLFPLFTPLFFLFSFFSLIGRGKPGLWTVPLFLIALVGYVPAYRSGPGIEQIIQNFDSWTAEEDDLAKAFDWVRENVPADAVTLTPPTRKDVWYRSQRATIVSFRYPVYSNLTEWRKRIDEVTGGVRIQKAENAIEEVDNAYSKLSPDMVIGLKRKYGVSYILTRSQYSFEIVYQNSHWTIYKIQGGDYEARK